MDSPETLATLSNGQSRDTGNIEQWTVQRHLVTLSTQGTGRRQTKQQEHNTENQKA
jgi:hypothetical protein